MEKPEDQEQEQAHKDRADLEQRLQEASLVSLANLLKDKGMSDIEIEQRLQKAAEQLGVMRERVRAIEKPALRRLRHPRVSKQLRDYLE